MFDGEPDETIPEDLQFWASMKYQEFSYRKMFGLSKREMMEEPMEDVVINFKLNQLVNRKQESENAMMEERAKNNSPQK